MKTNMKKLVAALLLGGMMMAAVPMASMADSSVIPMNQQEESEIAPHFTYIVDAMTSLEISGSTATVDCWVKGDISTATKAKVIAELQVKSSETNWIPVAIWTDTRDGFEAYVYETKTINPNNTYRVKATYTVWEGSQSETHTAFVY